MGCVFSDVFRPREIQADNFSSQLLNNYKIELAIDSKA